MRYDILAFPTPAAQDRAVAALPMLRRLRDALRAAKPRPAAAPVFFFRPEFQAELPPPPADPLAAEVAAAEGLLADAGVRHAARAVPGLVAAARTYPGAATLAAKLAIPDDEVFLVLHPAAGIGWRVAARGAATVGQFHGLFADAVADQFPGARPAGGRFGLFQPHAVGPDGALPAGWAGADAWLWDHHPLASVPTVDGERVVLLGDPAGPAEGDADARFPDVPASVGVVEMLSTAAVDGWLRAWCGAAPARRAAPRLLQAA